MLGQSLATILSLLTFHQLTPALPSHLASWSADRKPWQGGFTDLHSLGQATAPTSLLFPLKKNIKPTFHIHPLNNSLGSSYRVAKCPPCPRQRPRVHYRILNQVPEETPPLSTPSPRGHEFPEDNWELRKVWPAAQVASPVLPFCSPHTPS